MRWLLLLCVMLALPLRAEQVLTMGVFAYRDKPVMEQMYQPLAAYLSEQLPDVTIRLLVLTQDEIEQELARNNLDLVFTNPSHYLLLRSQNALTGVLATKISRERGTATSALGGVIITRNERSDIQHLAHLRGQTVAIPGYRFLGGFQAQALELLEADMTLNDIEVDVAGSHGRVVEAVLNATADAGFVRTGILEGLSKDKQAQLKIINRQHLPGFPFWVSTRLYPEWPFLALPNVSPVHIRRIASALMALDHQHPAAQAAGIEGFAPPGDYLPVENLARRLRQPPFDVESQPSLVTLWRFYGPWLLFVCILLLLLSLSLLALGRKHLQVRQSRKDYREQSRKLEEVIWGTGIGVWEWQAGKDTLSCSEQCAYPAGYRRGWSGPVSAERLRAVFYAPDLAVLKERIHALLTDHSEQLELELRMRRRRGGYAWVLVKGRLVTNGAGARVSGTLQDITQRRRQQELIISNEERLRTIVSFLPMGIVLTDHRGRVVHCNSGAEQLLHMRPGHMLNAVYQQRGWRVQRPDGSEMPKTEFASYRAMQENRPVHNVIMELHTDSGVRWLKVSATPLGHANYRLVVAFYDITSERRADLDLRLAASVFSHSREAIMITDKHDKVLDVNQAFTRITGYSSREMIGQPGSMLHSGRHAESFYRDIWQALASHGYWQGEVWSRRKSGEQYAQMLSVSRVQDDCGRSRHYVFMFSDITPLLDQQEKLERIAHYDALTGLPNRLLLADRIQQALAGCRRQGGAVGIVYLDLDGFKAVNDTHGHDAGDELLKTLAARMQQSLRENDTLGRLGGDEFVAVLAGMSGPDDGNDVLARLLQAASEPVTLSCATVQVSASLGMAVYPRDGVDADQLMRRADVAMYAAKQAGKNGWQRFGELEQRQLEYELSDV